MSGSTKQAGLYRILSIDGGGLRGIIALAILERLDAATPGWRDAINMYAGTSTGGLIALGLAKGLSPSDLLSVYLDQGARIFERSLWQDVKDLGQLTGPGCDLPLMFWLSHGQMVAEHTPAGERNDGTTGLGIRRQDHGAGRG